MQYTSHLKENLIRLRRQRGMRQDDLAEAASRLGPEVTRSNIASIETRENPTTDVMKAIAIAKVFGLSVEQLVCSVDIQESTGMVREEAPELNTASVHQNGALIPYFREGAKGQGDDSFASLTEKNLIRFEVSRQFINDLPGNTGIENLKVMIGQGFAMKPMFSHGDLLVVDTGVNQFKSDGVYFFRLNGHHYIKILERTPMGIRAASKSDDYSSWTIDETQGFQVLARVLRVWEGKEPV